MSEQFPERNALIRAMRKEGLSASAIARVMGITRNAVIGVWNRLPSEPRSGPITRTPEIISLAKPEPTTRSFGLLPEIPSFKQRFGSVTSSLMGDPLPGRSALDQRRAS